MALSQKEIVRAAWASTSMPDVVALLKTAVAMAPGSAEETEVLSAVAAALKSRQPAKNEEGEDVEVVVPRCGHVVENDDAAAVAAAALAGAVQFAKLQGVPLHPERA